MSFKQHVALGVTLLGSVALIGASVQPTNAIASKRGKKVAKVYRTKAVKVSHKAYYSLSKTGKTYKLSGSRKKTVLKANHALKNYKQTTWTRSKQIFVTKKGKKARYYYVTNAKNRAAGWVKASALKAGKNGQATSPKKISAKTYYKNAKAGKYYQLKGNNQYITFKSGHKLVAKKKYQRSQKRYVYKHGKRSTYYCVKQGRNQGWVWNGYLTTKAPAKAKAKPKAKKVTDTRGLTKRVGTSNGIATYQTSGDTVTPYYSKDFSTVNVPSQCFIGKYAYQYASTYHTDGTFQPNTETLGVIRHMGADSNYDLRATIYLPLDSGTEKAVYSNPQSAAFSKDDHYLYVMYLDHSGAKNHTQMGWVVRYDWQKLTALGTRKNGQMQLIRKAANNQFHGRATSQDRAILNCIKVGPTFNSGHAQSLALNPKTNELWFVKDHDSGAKATVERLNADTLKPDAAVNFTLKSTLPMGGVLTFDDAGNAYFWSLVGSPWPTAPKNSAKIYKGQISTSRVKFSLVMQGLSKAPGATAQSIGYNHANKRLYLVSDGSIFSVPTSKLGHLKASDVSATNFTGKREFEGAVFMHRSNTGYVLLNRGPALYQMINK